MAAIWLHSALNASPFRTPASGIIVSGTGTERGNAGQLKQGHNCGNQTDVQPPANQGVK